MMFKATTLALLGLTLALQTGCTTSAANDSSEGLQSIPSLDVPRYMGTWYEIAKYPNRFQRQCVSNTRADYSLQPDGRVQVVNSCEEQDGSRTDAAGIARQIGAADSAQLKVRFAPAWLSFIPMVWGDYWVIELDPDYQLAAVSEPSREYLWILSRTPAVDGQTYRQLLNKLEARDFDIGKLARTPQDAAGSKAP
jgi:apolipoprotein D and lipocalin family protein